MLKRVTIAVTLLTIACSMPLPAYAVFEPRQIDIPAENLVPALEALQRQAQVHLLYEPHQLRTFRTNGLRGTYEPHDAVRMLLKGTPLQLQVDQSGVISIVNTATASVPAGVSEIAPADNTASDTDTITEPPIFANGFEEGDTGGWSSSVG